MSAHDRAVDHRVFIVGVDRQTSKDAVPDITFCPATVPPVRVVPVTEAFREVAPGDARAITVQHRVHEKTVVRGSDANRPARPGKLSLIRSHWSSRSRWRR